MLFGACSWELFRGGGGVLGGGSVQIATDREKNRVRFRENRVRQKIAADKPSISGFIASAPWHPGNPPLSSVCIGGVNTRGTLPGNLAENVPARPLTDRSGDGMVTPTRPLPARLRRSWRYPHALWRRGSPASFPKPSSC